VSFSCFSNSNQPKRSCAFFIPRTPFKTSARSLSNPLFKRARFPGREDDGKLLTKRSRSRITVVPSSSSSVSFVVTFLLFHAAMWRSSPEPKIR